MNQNQNTSLLTSSNEEPDLKWTAPRAPKFTSYNRRALSVDDLIAIAECQISMDDRVVVHTVRKQEQTDSMSTFRNSVLSDSRLLSSRPPVFLHADRQCNNLSLCEQCGSLRKSIKLMRKLPDYIEMVIEHYYTLLGRLNMHMFHTRLSQDRLTFDNQTNVMQAQIARGISKYRASLSDEKRAYLRNIMIVNHSKRTIDVDRRVARDQKYETAFVAEGLGPIEHARGDCTEYYSMCADCLSLHKCFTMAKRCPERRNAGYSLFWRIFEQSPPRQARMYVEQSIHWAKMATENAANEFLETYFMYAPELGPNYSEMNDLYNMFKERQSYLVAQRERLVAAAKKMPSPPEGKFTAQAWFTPQVEIKFPTIDKITDMLNRLIIDNNITVDPTQWARRLTSFVLMLMQLCAESSLFIKVTAVAQFLTHFPLPGLQTFRGYAQRLAQVFQDALENIRRVREDQVDPLFEHAYNFWHPYDDTPRHEFDDEFFHRLGPEDDDANSDDETPFQAQGDTEEKPEGFLIGTAKLMLAMGGVTDYNIKDNQKRVTRLDQLSRTITSTERLAHFVERLFTYAYDLVCKHVFGMHPDMRELALVSEKIPVWMDKVTSYYNNEGLVRVTKNLDEARAVMAWQKQGDEYNALLWKFKTVPKAYAIFKNVYNMCDRMTQAAGPYMTDSAMRVSPFSILLTGPPGLGKSVVQYALVTDIMKEAFALRGLVFKPGEHMHVRDCGGKHWDGYNGQPVVFADDVYQNQESMATIQQCMDICRMKNMVSWPVPKADLGSKGNTFMTSELLMMTGNVAVPHDINRGVRSFDAIRRRIDLLIHLKLKKEYLNSSGRMDVDRVARDFPSTYVDGLPVAADITSIMLFTVLDNENKPLLTDGTYDEMSLLCRTRKAWQREREEGIIRANYLRAGLDIHGVEKQFQAQGLWGNNSKEPDDAYVGDLLFESDVTYVRSLLDEPSNYGVERGFLTEEEAIEIATTINQSCEPDPTWVDRMCAVHKKVLERIRSISARFGAAIGNMVDRLREEMQGHLMFKVGAMVLLAVSIISTGFLIHRAMAPDTNVCEGTSGDEKTRMNQTRMVVETSGDEKTRQTTTQFAVKSEGNEVARRVLYKKNCVAVHTTPRSTVWVPETKIPKGQKPLLVRELLWTDTGEELPRDIISSRDDGFVAQACPDRNAYNLGINRITTNAVVVSAYHEDRVVSELRGLFVYGRVLMVPLHCFYGLSLDDTRVELKSAHGQLMTFNTNECEIKIPKIEMDIIFLRLPKRFQCYSDLRSHFHSSTSLNKNPLQEAMLWVIDGDANTKMVTLCTNIEKDAVLDYNVSAYSSTTPDKNIHLVKSYSYRGMTLGGYCGSPLIWLNPSVQGGHILGVHVAGTNLRGLTTPITKEFLYEFLSDWSEISLVIPTLDHDPGVMTAQSKRAVHKGLPLAHYGRVSGPNQVRLPTETTIIPSPLFGIYEPVTAPALLTPTKTLNPLRSGILKQCVPLVVFDPDIVAQCVEHLKNDILGVDSPYRQNPCVLTADEALNGFPGDKWIPPMNLHTSPGYPYINSNTSHNGKFDFVTGEPGERRLHPYVQQKVEERIEKARNRQIDMTLFMDILKDERVKLAKVKEGKTRIFNVAPFDLNVVVRMYFQKFAAHVMYNHVYGECAVGLNPHSDEWGLMYYHLAHIGDNWIGGDYSNYDKQLSYQLLKAVLTIIDEFYADDNNDIRECMFEIMFSAFHIAERDVYRVGQGNPSGIVMTSLVNSLVNSLMMRIIYVELGGKLSEFTDHIRLKTYGDDNIANVSNHMPWFNMTTISRQFAKHGIIYNQPNKDAMREDQHYLTLDELTFLKRGFRFERGRVLAPLNIDSIHEMMNWIRESNDDCLALQANFLAACREMYHYGRAPFQVFTTECYTFAHKRAFKLPYTDYFTSGEYWGAEKAECVNFTPSQTTHGGDDCYTLDAEEVLFSAQSGRAPHKIKAVWPSLCDLLIIAAIIDSTSNQSNTEPTESTASSATNADNVTTRTEITTFSDSSVVTLTSPQHIPNVPSTPVDPYMKQSLTDFLSRVYYESHTWTSTDTMGSLLLQITFPNFLFSVPQIWDKLKNFTYFRAGVKISLRMNGSKFHYGQVLVSYSPQWNNTLDLQPSTNNIISASGCPCFTVSPSENEVHEFTLPFALPYQYIPMYMLTGANGDAAFQFGVVNIHVLNVLSNTGATPTPVTYTVFANFVDVDVAGYNPISYTIPTRITKNQATLPATGIPYPARPSTASQLDPLPPFTALAEDPFVAQKASREQVVKSEKGIVGSVLESVSAISGALSFIPEIGVVAAGVSAATGGAAMVANYFGWSNPTSLRAIQPVVLQYSNMVNTHGLQDCQNLGIHPESVIAPATELLGGSGKEMAMLYIAQTPSLLNVGTIWNGTDTTDTGLWETNVTPTAELVNVAGLRTFPTHLSWISRTCLFWRGSIRYHIQITCSQMHVGRLRISYIPLNQLTALDSNEYASGASIIVDIQQQTSVAFTVPYLFYQPWCPTVQDLPGINQYPKTGTLRISVLNELNHPNTPVPPVFINVWTAAGPDFQLARPSNRWLRQHWTTTSNDPEPPPEIPLETAFVAQGMTRDMIRTMPAPSLIPAHGSREENISNADEFHHVKDLIMRPTWMWTLINVGAAAPGTLRADPFAPSVRLLGSAWADTSFRDYFRLIFRFSRGSSRFIIAPDSGGGLPSNYSGFAINNEIISRNGDIAIADLNPIVGVAGTTWVNLFKQGLANGLSFAVAGQPSTATIPYYSTIYGMPNAGFKGSLGSNVLRAYGQTPAARINWSGTANLFIAAGDDYELVFLVGPPALTYDGT